MKNTLICDNLVFKGLLFLQKNIHESRKKLYVKKDTKVMKLLAI